MNLQPKSKVSDLPEDILFEIQLRLPVKSLLRFRSVCRAWNARFRNPEFIRAHYCKQKELDDDTFSNSKLLLGRHGFCQRFLYDQDFVCPIYLASLRHEKRKKTLIADEEILLTYVADYDIYIFGSCNGIVCIENYHPKDFGRVALWNPATREFNRLPPPTSDHAYEACQVLGFGYDHKTDDYKVLSLRYIQEDIHKIDLCSVRNNKWKEINTNGCQVVEEEFRDFDVYINGVCHHPMRENIVSFDVAEETFMMTPTPNFGKGFDDWCLTSFQESVASIAWEKQGDEKVFDLWVLKETGVKESWSRKFRIGPVLGIKRPLNGCVFIKKDDDELAIYDNEKRLLVNQRIESGTCLVPHFNYIESLFSINGKSEEEEKILRLRV